jgi:hypothetical protein
LLSQRFDPTTREAAGTRADRQSHADHITAQELQNRRDAWRAIPADGKTPSSVFRILATAIQQQNPSLAQPVIKADTPQGKAFAESTLRTSILRQQLYTLLCQRFGEIATPGDGIVVDVEDGLLANLDKAPLRLLPNGSIALGSFILQKSLDSSFRIDFDTLATDPAEVRSTAESEIFTRRDLQFLQDHPHVSLEDFRTQHLKPLTRP